MSHPESEVSGTDQEQRKTSLLICPTIATLLDPGIGLSCPVSGCSRLVTKHSTMGKHLQDHMPLGKGDSTSLLISYHCPVQACPYSSQNRNGSTFKSMKYLRQHYMKLHASKEFTCGLCEKSFGSRTFLNIHERMCGIVFKCSCSKVFNSLPSLQTHARRRSHSFDLDNFREILKGRKTQELEKAEVRKVKNKKIPDEEPPPPKKVKSKGPPTARCTTQMINIPILPKIDQHVARVLLLPLKTPYLAIDIGTQTTPLLVRKRSSTQQSQTEHKSTKTTGTLTSVVPTMTSDKIKRKTSAQTQTSKLRISTETQTPVVTKRKRCTRNKQITTATTQTPRRVLKPLVNHESKSVSFASQHTPLPMFVESFDEVHSQTQTDPNPFFGYPAHRSHLEVFFSEDTEMGEGDNGTGMTTSIGSNLKTIETQTIPTPKMGSERIKNHTDSHEFEPLKDGDYFSCSSRGGSNPSNSCGFSLGLQTPSMGEDTLGSYLETMDSETQTTLFDSNSTSFSNSIY